MRRACLAVLIFGFLAVAGCATKTYGRVGTLTSFESSSMSCREIDLDMARTQGFIQHVNNESQFSGKDVLAFLGDFGIGNSMEKSAAMDSAIARMGQLQSLKAAKCQGGTDTSSVAAGSVQPPAVTSSGIIQPTTTPRPPTEPVGQDVGNVERIARQQACHADPKANLTARGAGFETYVVACSSGDSWIYRCELGNCRKLQ